MKKSLKCLSVILVMLITLFSFSITAMAQTTEQDGLQVSLTTDKQSYSLNEDIEITVSVMNINDFTVEDVSIEALLPDNFELKDSKQNTSARAVDLKAGEQTSLSVIAVVKGQEENPTEPSTKPDDTTKPTESTTDNKNNQNINSSGQTTTNNNNNKSDKADKNTNTKNNKNGTSPYTGADYTFMGIFLVLFLASVSTLFYCLIKRFKKTTKIVSSVLCAVIAVTSVIGFSTFNAFAQENKSTVTVSKQIKVDNDDYTINANIKYKVNDNIKIKLISDETEFSAEIKNKKIVFFAETDKKLDYIDLVCRENASLSIKLFDNGLDNDNAKGDNIYSGAVVIDCNKENQYNFYAVYKQSISNTVVIDIIEPFTDKELNDMESVDKMLSNLMKSEHYQSLDINSKKEEIEKVLYHCEDNGLIQENSIYYHDFPKSFEFKYDSGISGGVTFEKISPDVSTVNVSNKDMISLAENNSGSLLSSKISKRTKDLEEAILIYDLYSREEKQEEYDINQDIAKQWSENGLKTDFYTNPTVDDYKTILTNKKISFIQEHGIELVKWNWGLYFEKVYCFTIREQVTKENKQKYHTDLQKDRIYSETLENGTTQYCISPDFFTFYYDNNKLDDSIVILGNCMGFGNEQVVDYNFSFDLCEKCGANTVIGFHNSVNTSYSDVFNCNFVLQLLKNKSVKEAFDYVQSEYGYNDNEFLYKFTDLDQYCDKDNKITWREFISNKIAATPILSGETSNKLNHRYTVSSIVKDSTTNNPIKDVRVEVIDNSSDSFEPIVTTTTDESGNFSLNLPYGEYSLSFNHDSYNYYGMTLDVDSDYVVLQNPILLNPISNSSDFEYRLIDDGTAEITGYTGSDTKITIPSVIDNYTVTKIGDFAFNNYESLSTIIIPNNIKSIGVWSFGRCVNLTSVTIPDSLTNIGNNAFYNCRNLENILIPNSVTDIGDEVFGWCTNLKSIVIPSSITNIGNNAFYCCDNLENIIVDEQNKYYSSQDGVLFNKSKTELIRYPSNNTKMNYNIPDKVINIDLYAFFNCKKLVNITIPNSIKNIGNEAFCYCENLENIIVDEQNKYYSSQDGVLYNKNKTELIQYPTGNTRTNYSVPNNVVSIGNLAFNGCDNLINVVLPNGITNIDSKAFQWCTNLKSIILPDSVEIIGEYAFFYCWNLTTITINNKSIIINDGAFARCDMLKDVYFGGTTLEWNKLFIGSANEYLTNATIHYCN